MIYLIAARNVAQHPRRSLLVCGAMAAVTALLVVLFGLLSSVRHEVAAAATTVFSGHVNIAGYHKPTADTAVPVVADVAPVLAAVRAAVPELEYAGVRGVGDARLVGEQGTALASFTAVVGVDLPSEPGLSRFLRLRDGSLDALSRPKAILLTAHQAEELKVGVGDLVTLLARTQRGAYNSVDLRVAAIADNGGLLSAPQVFVSSATLRQLYQYREGSGSVVQLHLQGEWPEEKLRGVVERVRTALTAAGYTFLEPGESHWRARITQAEEDFWTGQRLDVTTWKDELSTLDTSWTALNVVIDLLGGILLAIVCAGLMNTLWLAIRERTREIGTLRSIGMQRRKVVALFLAEGQLLGLLGSGAGALLGVLLCWALTAANIAAPESVQFFIGTSESLRFTPRFGSVVETVFWITLCTTVVSLFPSFLAARLKPISAINQLG